jgi:hypothetical protein
MHMLDRSAVMQRTTTAKIAALVLAGLGVLVAVVGVPGLRLPEVRKADVPTAPAPVATQDPTPSKPAFGFAGVAERLSLVSNHPVLPDAAPPKVDDTPVVETAPPQAPPELAKFLGVVTLGSTHMALVAREDKQSFVKVGDKVGEHVLREIGEDFIRLEANGQSTRIEQTAKGSEMVTHATATGGSQNPFAGTPNNPAAQQAARNAQRQQQMNNPAYANAQAAAKAARGTVNLNNGTTFTPPQFSPNFPYAHIMADPQRRQRFGEIQAKLRNGGEYKTPTEIDEAAAKMTEQEFTGTVGQGAQKGAK